MAAVAAQWNKEHQEKASSLKAPPIMFQCFIQEWRPALEKLKSVLDVRPIWTLSFVMCMLSSFVPPVRW